MKIQRKTKRELETVAFGREIDWESEATYGTVFFGPEKSHQLPPLPISTAETLLEDGFVDPDQRHNESPRAEKLIHWASSIQHQYKYYQIETGVIGYLVSPDRPDSRIAVTGVSIRGAQPVPEQIEREAVRELSPDWVEADDFNIRLQWD